MRGMLTAPQERLLRARAHESRVRVNSAHGRERIERLQRRADFITNRIEIAAEIRPSKEMNYDKAEASALRWAIAELAQLDATLQRVWAIPYPPCLCQGCVELTTALDAALLATPPGLGADVA